MATNSSITSDLLVAGTSTVVSRKTRLDAFIALSDGTNLATVTIYDNASTGSGVVVGKALASSGSPTATITFDNPVKCDLGITVVVSGTGAGAIVYYDA